jgi:cytochrome c553
MKRVLTVSLALLAMAGFAQAGGDAEAGKAKAAACGACHGADGNSPAPSFPKLAGQGEKYLVKQMNDIDSGIRPVPTMAGQLDNMTEQDIADIAAYYSAQTGTIGVADPELVARGESIYRAGDSAKGVAACTACHSPTGKGNAAAGFPALAGQHAAYIEAQLMAFRTGAEEPEKGRINDGETRMMRDVARPMSDLDIRAVASYIQGLH